MAEAVKNTADNIYVEKNKTKLHQRNCVFQMLIGRHRPGPIMLLGLKSIRGDRNELSNN